jgi:hypothetical protein
MSVKSLPTKIMTQISLTWMSCDGGEWKLKIKIFFFDEGMEKFHFINLMAYKLHLTLICIRVLFFSVYIIIHAELSRTNLENFV